MAHGLDRQAEVCRRAEEGARLSDVEIGLSDVRSLGADRLDEVDTVVDQQRHPGALECRDDPAAEVDQLVVRRAGITQLYHGHPGTGSGGHRCR